MKPSPFMSEAEAKTGSSGSSGSVRGLAAIITLSTMAQLSLSNQAVGNKDFATTTRDTRAAIDAKYAEMAAQGTPMDYMHATQDSWDTVYGGLDRRSPFAIASNSSGSFSKDEQDTAQSIMSQQQGEAMMAADPTGRNPSARYRAGIAFLKRASDDEKASSNWAAQRAAVQFGYEQFMWDNGQAPDNADSDSPLVRMIKDALEGLRDKAAGSVATGGYIEDLTDLPLFCDGMPTGAAGTEGLLDLKA